MRFRWFAWGDYLVVLVCCIWYLTVGERGGATRVVFGVMLCYGSLVFWFEVVVSVLLLCGLVLGI